jgi:hypothetical protein
MRLPHLPYDVVALIAELLPSPSLVSLRVAAKLDAVGAALARRKEAHDGVIASLATDAMRVMGAEDRRAALNAGLALGFSVTVAEPFAVMHKRTDAFVMLVNLFGDTDGLASMASIAPLADSPTDDTELPELLEHEGIEFDERCILYAGQLGERWEPIVQRSIDAACTVDTAAIAS